MENYRLITLLNVDYKILTRVIMSRIRPVIENFVRLKQTEFLSGRQIRDNVMSVNLAIYLVKVEKRASYIIFLDIQKAYNRVVYN